MKYFNSIDYRMENLNKIFMLQTGICESSYPKKFLMGIIISLKKILNEKAYIIKNNSIVELSFSDVINNNGCISLCGINIEGTSLYETYINYETNSFFSNSTKKFLSIIQNMIKLSKLIKKKDGFYPSIFLNGIYIKEDGSITFIPIKIVDVINNYYDLNTKKIMNYCINRKNNNLKLDEDDFVLSLSKLIYLFFIKNENLKEEPIFNLRSFIEDIPSQFSDTIWNILHGKNINLQRFSSVILNSTHKKKLNCSYKIPLKKRKKIILFKYHLSNIISRRWKLILIILIGVLLIYFLLSDILKNRGIDYTKGLNQQQVVELYLKAVDNLDIDVIDYIFYKKAGKDIKKELSTLYVITKISGAYGNKIIKPFELGSKKISLNNGMVYGIKDIKIKKVSDNQKSIFLVNYKKIMSSGDKIEEYYVEEDIQLKKIKDHWYIIKSDRTIKEK